MKSIHLSDEILQAYLLKEIQDETIDTHLRACSSCQKKLEGYQFLIENVKKIKPETFSFDVTSLVMAKINQVEAQKEKNTNTPLYISLSLISIAALALLYPYIKTIFTQSKSFSTIGNVLLLVSALGVAVFLLNDLFRQYKQKEMLLLQ